MHHESNFNECDPIFFSFWSRLEYFCAPRKLCSLMMTTISTATHLSTIFVIYFTQLMTVELFEPTQIFIVSEYLNFSNIHCIAYLYS